MSATETTAIVEASLRRAAAVEDADRILIRQGLPSYSRLAADAALVRVGFDTAMQVTGLRLLHAAYGTLLLRLRTALRIGAREVRDAIQLADRGEWEPALNRLDEVEATMRKQAGPAPERLPPGVIDFAAAGEAVREARRFREITGGAL